MPQGTLNFQGTHIIWEAYWPPTITDTDQKASAAWVHAHSVLARLSRKRGDLYWDGKKVNLGKVAVGQIYEAIPWQGGVFIYGSTVPRRGFFHSWPFTRTFSEELTRDIEPYCAIYFDLATLKGEDRWLNGKMGGGFLVFPIPDQAPAARELVPFSRP